MELTIHLNGNAKKNTNAYRSVEEFENSFAYKKGWRTFKEPSKAVKDMVENKSTETEAPKTEKDNTVSMESIWTKYVEVTGKKVPARYKNDTEWLNKKINEG